MVIRGDVSVMVVVRKIKIKQKKKKINKKKIKTTNNNIKYQQSSPFATSNYYG